MQASIAWLCARAHASSGHARKLGMRRLEDSVMRTPVVCTRLSGACVVNSGLHALASCFSRGRHSFSRWAPLPRAPVTLPEQGLGRQMVKSICLFPLFSQQPVSLSQHRRRLRRRGRALGPVTKLIATSKRLGKSSSSRGKKFDLSPYESVCDVRNHAKKNGLFSISLICRGEEGTRVSFELVITDRELVFSKQSGLKFNPKIYYRCE